MKAKTPKSWTVKSRIFSAQTIRDSAYDFEQNTYSATPAVLYLCWQPVSASAPIEERGIKPCCMTLWAYGPATWYR